MIIKLTPDHDLFSWLETNEEHKWFDKYKSLPLSMMVISSNHIQNYADEWYKENMGGQLWYHLKN